MKKTDLVRLKERMITKRNNKQGYAQEQVLCRNMEQDLIAQAKIRKFINNDDALDRMLRDINGMD
jgi:hypothetical protein